MTTGGEDTSKAEPGRQAGVLTELASSGEPFLCVLFTLDYYCVCFLFLKDAAPDRREWPRSQDALHLQRTSRGRPRSQNTTPFQRTGCKISYSTPGALYVVIHIYPLCICRPFFFFFHASGKDMLQMSVSQRHYEIWTILHSLAFGSFCAYALCRTQQSAERKPGPTYSSDTTSQVPHGDAPKLPPSTE